MYLHFVYFKNNFITRTAEPNTLELIAWCCSNAHFHKPFILIPELIFLTTFIKYDFKRTFLVRSHNIIKFSPYSFISSNFAYENHHEDINTLLNQIGLHRRDFDSEISQIIRKIVTFTSFITKISAFWSSIFSIRYWLLY